MSGFKFCPGCGRELPAPADSFCPHCGYQLRRHERPAPRPPAAPPQMTYAPPTEPRRPHSWMDTSETPPRPVVPLAQTRPPQTTPQGAHPTAAPIAPPFVPASAFACPDCGGLVTRGSFACPRCGRRFAPEGVQAFQPPKGFNEKWLGVLLIALLAAIVILYFC